MQAMNSTGALRAQRVVSLRSTSHLTLRVRAVRPVRTVAARRTTVRVNATIAMPSDAMGASTAGPYWGPDCPEHVAEWRKNLDLKAFGKEMRMLERELKANQGEEDVKHLKGVLNASTVLYCLGLALAPFCNVMHGNILAALCLSTGIFARWTMVGHHTSHGGYNSQQNGERFHRSTFAKGPLNRFLDWLDWMLPEAWDVEHNNLHHYKLGETNGDPDLIERNVEIIRQQPSPRWFKYIQVYALMATWKWYYYAPNTLKEMYTYKAEREASRTIDEGGEESALGENPFKSAKDGEPGTVLFCVRSMLGGNITPLVALAKCALPFFLFHFVAVPAPFYAFGGAAMGNIVLANMVAAEIITNLHSFLAIATNHCGNDVYRFETTVKPKTPEFYLRAIIGSVNYPTAGLLPKPEGKPSGVIGNVNDFIHGWLNYQIEHHMFPDLSMLSYQKAMPIVKAACEKYGIPYVQEDMFTRLKKTTDVMVGKANMLQWERGD